MTGEKKLTFDTQNFVRENFASENKIFYSNFSSFIQHGQLSGTGKLLVLPVDQGFEHGPERSFLSNPESFDPHYHYKFAKIAGFSAFCAPIGILEATHSLRTKELQAFGLAFAESFPDSVNGNKDSSYRLPYSFSKLLQSNQNFESAKSFKEFREAFFHTTICNNQHLYERTKVLRNLHLEKLNSAFEHQIDWARAENYDSWKQPLPTILKLNSGNYLDASSSDGEPDQSLTASVADAVRLGCSGIGFTLYPGSLNFAKMLEQLKIVAAEAKEAGLVVMVWAYPRGRNLSLDSDKVNITNEKDARSTVDITTYAVHLACLMGAHIIKTKMPENTFYWKDIESRLRSKENTPTELVQYIKRACFDGRRMVLFSGGEKADESNVRRHVVAIKNGGGDGSIIGRNCFQRPFREAIDFVNRMVQAYLE